MTADRCKRQVVFCEDCGTGHVNASPGCVCYLCDGSFGPPSGVFLWLPALPSTVGGTVGGTSLSSEGVVDSKRLVNELYATFSC